MLKMLSCWEGTALLSQALDRPLRLHERFNVRLHLLSCKGCRATLRHFMFLRTATRAWREHAE